MAIEWGAWEGGSPNRIRVGIDVDWSGPVQHGWGTVKATVKYYVDVEGNWSDSQTLTLSGAIDGTVNFSNNQNNSQALRETRERTYTYGNCEYGSSPGSWTFTVKLSGAFNGATPSKSVTKNIPSRPYGAPAAPTNVNTSRISDTSIKTTWTNKDTCGDPWNSVHVQRDDGANDVWNTWVGDLGGGATSFTDSSAYANAAFRYRVKSRNNVDDSSVVEGDLIYTTPAAPTNLTRTGNNAQAQTLAWTNDVSIHMDHRILVERQENEAGAYTEIATVGRDSTGYVDNDPYVLANPGKKFRYRVRARTNGGAQGTLYSSYSNVTTSTTGLSLPPNAPTSLNPAGSVLINPTQSRVFSWAYNSADGSAQTAYQIQWRVAGGAWNVMAKVVSGTQSPTIAASTFTDNSTIEWQVRTWGAASAGGSDNTGASPWSSTATFKTVGDPNALREQKRVMRLNLESGRPETAPTGVLPPIGSILMFGGAVAPAGWMVCQGQSLLRADYVDLFGVIGTAFGSVDSLHFNLPNMIDRFPIGAGTKAVGSSGGSSTKVITAANLPPHDHSIAHDHDLDFSSGTGSTGANIPLGTTTFNRVSAAAVGPPNTANSGNGPGTSSPMDIMPPWQSVHYIIKV